ncbi:hypothetical protein [Pseudomonas citronellolis]|uniref:hypothetical protein n=1 Tax=Pseudomonas citronellolis TaxID=53408 RepID=UPI003AAC0227
MSAGPFAAAIGRLHRVAHRRLADAVGDFHPQAGAPVKGLDLQVDRNLAYEGADGRIVSGQVGITWLAEDLATADRGDVFVIGCERFLVENLLADDAHAITAATTKL